MKKQKSPIFHRGKFVIEGCATFYKKQRFRKVRSFVLEFDEAAKDRISAEPQLQRLSKGTHKYESTS